MATSIKLASFLEGLVEVRSAKTLVNSGKEEGRGCIRLKDSLANRAVEYGFYEFGAGTFANCLYEFFTKGLSIRGYADDATYLAVRDGTDTNDLRLSHDGYHGVIQTTGPSGGSILVWSVEFAETPDQSGLYTDPDSGALMYRNPVSGVVTTLAE